MKEVKIEVYIPEDYVIRLREGLNNINALRIGNYDNCISITNVTGYWRPLEGANPFDGELNKISKGKECKVEFRCDVKYVEAVLTTIRQIHPYEEPVINVIPVINSFFKSDSEEKK